MSCSGISARSAQVLRCWKVDVLFLLLVDHLGEVDLTGNLIRPDPVEATAVGSRELNHLLLDIVIVDFRLAGFLLEVDTVVVGLLGLLVGRALVVMEILFAD